MSYESAPQTTMLDIACCVCGRPLCDAVSVELGIGPECRESCGFVSGAVSGEAWTEANKLVYRLAVDPKAAGAAALLRLRELGFEHLADRCAARVCGEIEVTVVGSEFHLRTSYNPEIVELIKTAATRVGSSRRWDRMNRCWVLDCRGVKAVVTALEQAGKYVARTSYVEALFADTSEPETVSKSFKPCVGSFVISGSQVQISTPYNPEAVTALKTAASGRARWNRDAKTWSVDLSVSAAVAEALTPFFPELSATMLSDPQIAGAGHVLSERLSLSEAAVVTSGGPGSEVVARLRAALPAALSLFPFQEAGVAFLEAAQGRALLADVMGLGKTVQALAWLAIRPEIKRTLIVVPASLVLNWRREATKWLPGRSVSTTRNGRDAIQATSIVITSYECVTRRVSEWMSWDPELVVLDECHYIKNQNSKRTKAISGTPAKRNKTTGLMDSATPGVATNARYVIALSGTPMLNRPVELFTTLHTIAPSTYPEFFRFAKRYTDAKQNRWGWDFTGSSNIEELRARLREIMVRREKDQVLRELPAKRRVEVAVQLSNASTYQAVRDEIQDLLTNPERKAERKPGDVLVALNTLRQIAGRGKVAAAIEWILNADRPVVVFCHHLEIIHQISEALTDAGIIWTKLVGDTSSDDRQQAVDDFQAGRARVFLGTVGAAGVGITLTASSDTLHVEREWTPSSEEQAEDRCHRIGQTESVTAWYLVADECDIDEKFARLVDKKRSVIKSIMDGAGQDEASLVTELANEMFGNG